MNNYWCIYMCLQSKGISVKKASSCLTHEKCLCICLQLFTHLSAAACLWWMFELFCSLWTTLIVSLNCLLNSENIVKIVQTFWLLQHFSGPTQNKMLLSHVKMWKSKLMFNLLKFRISVHFDEVWLWNDDEKSTVSTNQSSPLSNINQSEDCVGSTRSRLSIWLGNEDITLLIGSLVWRLWRKSFHFRLDAGWCSQQLKYFSYWKRPNIFSLTTLH